jgi:membrane-associated phospholipid phosphatase
MALLLAAVTAALWPEGAVARLAVFLSIAAATLLLASAAPRGGLRVLRDWLPVGVIITIFLLLQPIIEAGVPWRLDAALAGLDARYLASLVDAWRSAFGRPEPLTDAIYLAYFSYYLLPVTVAALAWRRGPEPFETTVFALLLAFYLTFLGYLILPASGPRLPLDEEVRELGGGRISDAVRAFLHFAETTTLDAFPSGHTTVAVIASVAAWRLLGRRAAAAIWAWAASIVFATVYINVHYAADVVAGLVLAGLVLLVCTPSNWRESSCPVSERARGGSRLPPDTPAGTSGRD